MTKAQRRTTVACDEGTWTVALVSGNGRGGINLFDPTAFENLKVVLEGAAYDLEREGRIRLIERHDLVDLSGFMRTFHLSFQLPHEVGVLLRLTLKAELSDFITEWMPGGNGRQPGCRLELTLQGSGSLQAEWPDLLQSWEDMWQEKIRIEWEEEREVSTFLHVRSAGVPMLPGQEPQSQERFQVRFRFLSRLLEENAAQLPGLMQQSVMMLEDYLLRKSLDS